MKFDVTKLITDLTPGFREVFLFEMLADAFKKDVDFMRNVDRTKPVEFQLTVNGHPADLEVFMKLMEDQLDHMVNEEATKLLNAKYDKFIDAVHREITKLRGEDPNR